LPGVPPPLSRSPAFYNGILKKFYNADQPARCACWRCIHQRWQKKSSPPCREHPEQKGAPLLAPLALSPLVAQSPVRQSTNADFIAVQNHASVRPRMAGCRLAVPQRLLWRIILTFRIRLARSPSAISRRPGNHWIGQNPYAGRPPKRSMYSGRGSAPSVLPVVPQGMSCRQNSQADVKCGVIMPCPCSSLVTEAPRSACLKIARAWLWAVGAISPQGPAKLSISQMLSHFLNQPDIMINEMIVYIIFIFLTFINCIK